LRGNHSRIIAIGIAGTDIRILLGYSVISRGSYVSEADIARQRI
jgi:hypothetical protein